MCRCDPDSCHPDLNWLEHCLQSPDPPRMVVLVNPNNPTGDPLTISVSQFTHAHHKQGNEWTVKQCRLQESRVQVALCC